MQIDSFIALDQNSYMLTICNMYEGEKLKNDEGEEH